MKKVIHQINNLVKKSLGPESYVALLKAIQRTERLADPGVLRKAHLDKFKAKEIQDSEFMGFLFDCYYNDRDANKVVVSMDFPRIASYAPYYKGFTSVFFHNFFKTSYGIRDPILIRYSLVDIEVSPEKVVWSRQYLLKPNCPLFLEDPSLTEDIVIESGKLVIEAFNPKIAIPANEVRFHILYRNQEKGSVSVVHSFAYQATSMERPVLPQVRSYAPTEKKLFYHTPREGHFELTPNEPNKPFSHFSSATPMSTWGYLSVVDDDNCPTAIWHDQEPFPVEKLEFPKTFGSNVEAAFLVPGNSRLPTLHFSSGDLSWEPEKVEIKIFSLKGELVDTKVIPLEMPECYVDLEIEFGHLSTAHQYVRIDFLEDWGAFKSRPRTMVDIMYRWKGGFSDQAHAEVATTHMTGYISHISTTIPASSSLRSFRCKKFAPLIIGAGLKNYYGIGNIVGGIQGKDDWVNLRIITDLGYEIVINEYPVPLGQITVISDREILEKIPSDKIQKMATIFFEQEFINMLGQFFIEDERTGQVAVDHFTGG
jgi:hypothetical protein